MDVQKVASSSIFLPTFLSSRSFFAPPNRLRPSSLFLHYPLVENFYSCWWTNTLTAITLTQIERRGLDFSHWRGVEPMQVQVQDFLVVLGPDQNHYEAIYLALNWHWFHLWRLSCGLGWKEHVARGRNVFYSETNWFHYHIFSAVIVYFGTESIRFRFQALRHGTTYRVEAGCKNKPSTSLMSPPHAVLRERA